MKNILLSLSMVCIAVLTVAQNTAFNWSSSLTDNRSFVENKGQFDGFDGHKDSDIQYALDGGQSMILFTEKGITFRLVRKVKNKNRERGDRTKPRYLEEKEFIEVKWVGANPNVQLVAESKTSDMHTYEILNSDRTTHQVKEVRGYSKLIYKNLYPHIDLEYVIHETEGIKYNLVLHPGADATQIKMLYSNGYAPNLDAKGNMVVSTSFGDIVDHAPSTFYSKTNTPINSRFKVSGNEVGFELDDYDHSQKIMIDPWVVTPAFPNSGGIWDIDVDDLGNVYIYGGDTPMRLQKYDPAGALLWTYNTPWDSANYWIGTMITEPISGDCYITAGTDPRISRINTGGTQDWTANGGPFDEYWKLSFNCDNTRLILGGTRLSLVGPAIEGYGQIFEIDMSDGSVLNTAQVASVTPGISVPPLTVDNPNEVRAMCPAPNGKYYYMTLDTIGVFTDNLTLGYQDMHGYNFSYRVAGYGVTNQSINAMAATTDHLYTHNGSVLDKRNIVDGSILSSVTIPNGVTSSQAGFNDVENGGLVLDSCGNVYVGSSNGVYKFDENLVQQSFQSTPGAVYDVSVNPQGEVVACGQGFVASLSLTPCALPKVVCLDCLELTPTGPYCHDGEADTLMADPAFGVWSGPGIVNPTLGIFDPSVAGPGTHTIFFGPDIPLVCGIDSLVIQVNFCEEIFACFNDSGDISMANGVGPFVWSEWIDTTDCSACINFPGFPECSFPPGCGVQTVGWFEFATDSTITPTGNWPIMVQDSNQNALVINALSELPPCEAGCYITVSLPDTVVACTGDSASATASIFGAIGNVDYSWSTTPEQTTANAFGLAPGSYYYVTVTDDSSCVAVDSVYVSEQECLGPIVCFNSLNDMVAEGIAPFTWFQQVDSTDCSACAELPGFPPCSFPPGCAVTITAWQEFETGEIATPTGIWPIAVVDGVGDTLFINAVSELQPCEAGCFIAVNLPDTVIACMGDSATATAVVTGAIGNVSYSWSTIPVQTTQTAVDLAPGSYYYVIVTDDSLCTAVDSVFVFEEECVGPIVCVDPFGDFTADGIGPFTWSEYVDTTDCSACAELPGFPPCSFPPGCAVTVTGWFEFSTDTTVTPTGNWPIVVVDGNGDSLVINAVSELNLCPFECFIEVDVPDVVLVCEGASNAEAEATVTGALGAVTYSWNTTPEQTTAMATGLGVGIYTVTVTDEYSCEAQDSVEVALAPAIVAQITIPDSICDGATDGTTTVVATGGAGGFQYSWNTTPEQTTATATGLSEGSYTVTVTDLAGCEQQALVSIYERAPFDVEFNATDDICIGANNGTATAIASNGTGPYDYVWGTNPDQNGATAIGLGIETYTVTATDQNGCEAEGSITLGTFPVVDADAGEFTTICMGQGATLSATGGVSYEWSSGDNTAIAEVIPDETTLYEVTVTDANGCDGSDTVTIFVIPIPQISIEEVDSVVCDVTPAFQIIGDPSGGVFAGDGISEDGVFDAAVAGLGLHTITYALTPVENCDVDTFVIIRVDEHLCDVQSGNVFNPNSNFEGEPDFCGNTPQNNVFSMECLELYPGNHMIIFDRWGRKCYDEQDYHLKPWDGGNNSDGVYYYILEIPGEEIVKGFFHLLH